MAISGGMKSWLPFWRKWGGSMGKSILLARASIRKAKGQMTAIILLLLLAAFCLNIWLMLSMDYKQNFVRYHERLNAEHVLLLAECDSEQFQSEMEEKIREDDRTEEFCMDHVLRGYGSFKYNGGTVDVDSFFLRKERALNREVGRVEITEEIPGSGIYLPLLYGMGDNYKTGDSITLTFGGKTVEYTVRGFFNSIMAGSHNCSVNAFLLTDDCYEELSKEAYVFPSTLFSMRIQDKEESEDYEAMVKDVLSKEYPAVEGSSNSYALVSQSRYISQMICSGIIIAMACFVTLIALAVIGSNVTDYVQENMQSLGALKAVGYTSGQLIAALLVQFLGVAFPVSITGIGLSYLVFPAVNTMMISQTGIPYAVHFQPSSFFLTLLLLEGVVALVVRRSSRGIRKIEAITALRQGIQTHNFRKNHIPLEKTRAPLSLALALKTTISGMKQNITVCITMLILSLILVFSGLMWRNMMVDIQPFVDLIAGESADSFITINAEAEEEFLQAIKQDKRVKKIYLYSATEVRHAGGLVLTANLIDDFSKVNNPGIVFEGREPEYENEVVIAAKYAREQNLKIGDEITLTAEGKKADFLITGFTQISNYLGKDCILTREGYERMGTLSSMSYYMDITEDTDVDAFNKEVSERFSGDILGTTNIQSVLEGTSAVYIMMITIIVAAILILGGLVIVFVLYLLVKKTLNKRRVEYGILKSLGFTTGQLVLQTALCFMPAILLSTAAGILISIKIINPLVALFLSGVGVVKCTFIIPVGVISAAGCGVILFTFCIACLLSLRVRKIAPRALLGGE